MCVRQTLHTARSGCRTSSAACRWDCLSGSMAEHLSACCDACCFDQCLAGQTPLGVLLQPGTRLCPSSCSLCMEACACFRRCPRSAAHSLAAFLRPALQGSQLQAQYVSMSRLTPKLCAQGAMRAAGGGQLTATLTLAVLLVEAALQRLSSASVRALLQRAAPQVLLQALLLGAFSSVLHVLSLPVQGFCVTWSQ